MWPFAVCFIDWRSPAFFKNWQSTLFATHAGWIASILRVTICCVLYRLKKPCFFKIDKAHYSQPTRDELHPSCAWPFAVCFIDWRSPASPILRQQMEVIDNAVCSQPKRCHYAALRLTRCCRHCRLLIVALKHILLWKLMIFALRDPHGITYGYAACDLFATRVIDYQINWQDLLVATHGAWLTPRCPWPIAASLVDCSLYQSC